MFIFFAYQEEATSAGTLAGNSIRAVVLRHEVSSSKQNEYWHMRGGEEIVFSVWDDDVAGVRTTLLAQVSIVIYLVCC